MEKDKGESFIKSIPKYPKVRLTGKAKNRALMKENVWEGTQLTPFLTWALLYF